LLLFNDHDKIKLTMSNFIKNFTELNKPSTHLASGKAASLGEMTQAGKIIL